jgi:hypothetical protein
MRGLKARPLDIVGYGDEEGDEDISGEESNGDLPANASELPLPSGPSGERVGVRGSGGEVGSPSPVRSAHDLSPAGRDEKKGDEGGEDAS